MVDDTVYRHAQFLHNCAWWVQRAVSHHCCASMACNRKLVKLGPIEDFPKRWTKPRLAEDVRTFRRAIRELQNIEFRKLRIEREKFYMIAEDEISSTGRCGLYRLHSSVWHKDVKINTHLPEAERRDQATTAACIVID